MKLGTRKILDRAFSGLGLFAILVMGAALLIILGPLLWRGAGAFFFRQTIERRLMLLEHFDRGDRAEIMRQSAAADEARAPVYEMMAAFEQELDEMPGRRKRELRSDYRMFKDALQELLGPAPGQPEPVMPRFQYGVTRWEKAEAARKHVLHSEKWVYPTAPDGTPLPGKKTFVPREETFAGTALEPAFPYIEQHTADMLLPQFTFYWRFLTDKNVDSHFFGGIWAEILGTFYLTIGAMIFAIPVGILSAVYLVEYAKAGRIISLIRICISTLAGVPSIVFGLFGLAFFINTVHVSESKSVLAGSLTLALLILPTVIRASEEALRAVPHTYKEAALSLGAGKWHTVLTVILPAALPGILTGVVISMGRAAGETAPIIFTAAVSVGLALSPVETLNQPTPALSWNIYNLATEHEAVEEIRHVQYGMVMTLVMLVLLLNLTAITLRARIAKKLHS